MTLPLLVYVDDAPQADRKVVTSRLRTLLHGQNCRIEDREPPASIEDIREWICDDDVCFLILDENLQLHKNSVTGEPVTYSGHNVVRFLAAEFPTFPCSFLATEVESKSEVVQQAAAVDALMDRTALKAKGADEQKVLVELLRWVRRARGWFERTTGVRDEIAKISIRIAQGAPRPGDLEDLERLQTSLASVMQVDSMLNPAYVSKLSELVALREALERLVEGTRK